MVSKKKRPPPVIEPADTASKKSKSSETACNSTASNTTAKSPKPSPRVSSKTKTKDVEETPAAPEIVQEHPCGTKDFPDWTPADLLELMKRMERCIPVQDHLRHCSRIERLDWDAVAFGEHSAQECKDTWLKVQVRIRKYRLLQEVLEDAKAWAAKPWTPFYRGPKENRHPHMPKRPLSAYMLFYQAMKDKVAKENPGLEMTKLSKRIAEMYKVLPEKKKKKYSDLAVAKRKQYEEKLQEFFHEHPELLTKNDKHDNKQPEVGLKRPMPPFKEELSQNPELVPANIKSVHTKEEKTLRERVAGKPKKPPNSSYSLYSRVMLASGLMKEFAPKERMAEISRMWKNLSKAEKKKFQEQVNHGTSPAAHGDVCCAGQRRRLLKRRRQTDECAEAT